MNNILVYLNGVLLLEGVDYRLRKKRILELINNGQLVYMQVLSNQEMKSGTVGIVTAGNLLYKYSRAQIRSFIDECVKGKKLTKRQKKAYRTHLLQRCSDTLYLCEIFAKYGLN